MTHEQCRERLSAWIDGALTGEESAWVAQHVASCGPCRAEADAFRALSASLRALPRQEIPADLKTRLAAGAPSRGWLAGPWGLAATAAFAVVVVIGVVGLRRPDAPTIARLEADAVEPGDAKDADRRLPPESAPSPRERKQETGSIDERFALSPPAAPDDAPAAESDQGVEVLGALASDRKETIDGSADRPAGESSVTMPPASQAEPSSAEIGRTEPGLPEAQVAAPRAGFLTYTALLAIDDKGVYRLESVEPPAGTGAKADELSAGDASAAGTPQDQETAPAPATMSRVRGDAAKPGTDDPPAQLMFLVELDAEGTVTSAQLVGARTTSAAVAETARSLLVGMRFPGTTAGRFSRATVRVLVPPPRK